MPHMVPPLYCNALGCLTRPEWLQCIGYLIAAFAAAFTWFSYFYTQRKLRALDRVKFSVEQHRRLFDDEVLFEILELIDAGEDRQQLLLEENMGNKKRKLITFFEEMVLLVRERFISEKFALYMFGYYAMQAKDNPYFMENLSRADSDFGIFFDFAELYRAQEGTITSSSIRITP